MGDTLSVDTGIRVPKHQSMNGSKMTAENKEEQAAEANNRPAQEVPELVAAGPDDRNWRGIGIALIVIGCVCALIVTAVVLLTPGDTAPHIRKSRISLEEVVTGAYNSRRFNGTWISGHEFLFQDSYGALNIYDVLNNTKRVIMSNTTFRQNSISSYSLSADRQYLLLSHKYTRVFRYTYKAAFLVYNLSSDHLFPLFPDSPDLPLQYADWGPSNNQLVYVLENDVYYMPSIDSKPRQLTTTGIKDIVFNGVPDWVYEEEVLSASHALWWSPDGKKLCFATFNDTEVDQITYSYYGSFTDIKNVYPSMIGIRYPKPGRTNPTVEMWVADLISGEEPIEVQPPKEYEDLEYYFTEAQWMDNNSLSIIWMKRSQNTSLITMCHESNAWLCIKNYKEDTYGNGWVDLYRNLVFTDDRKYYFVILPGILEGTDGRFRHIAMIEAKTGKKEYLTSGKFDVTDIKTYDAETKSVFYISTLEGKAGERHLFAVTDTTSPTPKKVTCLTCDLGPDCLYNDAIFSEQSAYYALECSGPGIPRVEMRYGTSNNTVVLDTNQDLRELTEKKAMPKIKKLQVPIAGDYFANVKLFLPPGLREDEITKYPLLLEVYAGPGSQMVKENFQVNWGAYLASKKNIIYAVIDGRGSGNQGDKILHELYRRLGTVEIYDQIAVTRYLRDKLPFVDESKIAVFGWSYGGYVSAMILATDDDVFKCGISVAPVTSWLYYDSVYTERYMQSPTANDNLINYEKSSVVRKAANFLGKKYLLVHGTADDNVHLQQSAMLAKALTDEGVLFQMQLYPDERHALTSVKMHLYRTLDKFLDTCYSDNDNSQESNDT